MLPSGLIFLSKHYGGYKIDEARRRYGPESFIYNRLFKKNYFNKKEAKCDLNKLYTQFIKLYNSVEFGYNSYKGVRLASLPRPNKEYKDCALQSIKYKNAEEGQRHKFRKVAQYDFNGSLIATYKSLSEASRYTQIHLSNISKCCKGQIKRVRNFIFKYDE